MDGEGDHEKVPQALMRLLNPSSVDSAPSESSSSQNNHRNKDRVGGQQHINSGDEHEEDEWRRRHEILSEKQIISSRVAIVGAGISGLAAAQKLHHSGFSDVLILEAQDRIGGRIWTHFLEDGSFLEMGAQWIHGEQGNPLHEWASGQDLLADSCTDYGDERTGIFCTQDGIILDEQMVSHALNRLDDIKEQLTIGHPNHHVPHDQMSVGKSFHEMYECFVQETNDSDHELMWALFDWYMVFENIDNACDDLRQLSLKGFSEWVDCPGVKLINLKDGYESVLRSLIQDIPNDWLKINTCVRSIKYGQKDVTIETNTEEIFQVDHVIVTISLGCLKDSLKSDMFDPPLPFDKSQLIESLGFGTINKIYLKFKHKFWTDSNFAVRLVWTKKCATHSDDFPPWVYAISGFDAVRGQNDMLVGWIGGQGAKDIESETNERIGKVCVRILKSFLPSKDITDDDPVLTICSKWFTNPFSRGSYSHRTVHYDQLKIPSETLSDPITVDVETSHGTVCCPQILFAGEATDKEFYSSTHGGLRSGLREAQRLVEYYTSPEQN